MKTPVIKKLHSDAFVGGGRRWFTVKAAALSEARRIYRILRPCECDRSDAESGYPGYACPNHDEPRAKFVKAFAKRILRQTKRVVSK